jgi:hypothetical protein
VHPLDPFAFRFLHVFPRQSCAEVHPSELSLCAEDSRLSTRVQIVRGDQGFPVPAVSVAVFVALEERDRDPEGHQSHDAVLVGVEWLIGHPDAYAPGACRIGRVIKAHDADVRRAVGARPVEHAHGSLAFTRVHKPSADGHSAARSERHSGPSVDRVISTRLHSRSPTRAKMLRRLLWSPDEFSASQGRNSTAVADNRPLNAHSRHIQRIYLFLLLLHTLAASPFTQKLRFAN